jgi:hypothetical protein
MKRLMLVGVIALILVPTAGVLEFYFQSRGWGHPPLYVYDPVTGYALKPSQSLPRNGNCRVVINSLGMRTHETTPTKRDGVFRVLVLGDSVPYGGSYIDQDDTFCSVAEGILNAGGSEYEILNAGVNAYGPRNVLGYIESRGLFEADMVIVYFPWGNLRRDFTNFYIVPFWSTSPEWASAGLFRYLVWAVFGKLSNTWKNIDAFDNELVLTSNLAALAELKKYCDRKGVSVFFFWSPYMEVIRGSGPDKFVSDRARFYQEIPTELSVDVTPALAASKDIPSLYVDSVHYSRDGHLLVGKFLAGFIKKRNAAISCQKRRQ